MRERWSWSGAVEAGTPEYIAREAFNARWWGRLYGARSRMDGAISGVTPFDANEGAFWEAARNRVFTLSASALGLSFLTLQIPEPEQPDLIPWTLLLLSVGLLLASMGAAWLARYLMGAVAAVYQWAGQLGRFAHTPNSGTCLLVGSRTALAVVLTLLVMAGSWTPAFVHTLEKPAGIVGLGFLIAAAFPLIEFARANV